MPYNHRKILLAAVIIGASCDIALAQMSNKPFSFKHSNDGIGMSVGGQQAIIDQKILGLTPKNILRDSYGALVDVQKGPGSVVIVTEHGTSNVIPGYHGTDFRNQSAIMSAGAFNPYFTTTDTPMSFSGNAPVQSGDTINTWTARVVSGGMPISYTQNNTIETWTGQVFLVGN